MSIITRLRKYKLAYLIFRAKNEFLQPYITLISRCKAFLWRVEVGSNVKFLGVPKFRNLGSIHIGDSTRIISDNRNVVGSEIKTTFETGVNGQIIIGKSTGISNCCIVAQSKVDIGDRVYIGGGVRIYDNDFHATNPYERINHPEKIPFKAVVIKTQAFVGGHSIILKGVTIGVNAVIGAGSVVTKNVGDNEIWAGVPAKKIGVVEQRIEP